MNKPSKSMEDNPSKPITNDKQRGIGVVELLFAATTIGSRGLVRSDVASWEASTREW